MTRILALDTSSASCSVALSLDDQIIIREEVIHQQAKVILSFIDELLSSAKIELNQLDAVSYSCGPGSFTGLRIAASVAQAFGFGSGIPIIPISSLAVLAQACFQRLGWDKMYVAVDARMSEVYWAFYEVGHHQLVELVGEEKVLNPATITMPEQTGYGVGNGWQIYNKQFLSLPKLIESHPTATAAAMIPLAKFKLARKQWIAPSEAIPVYLRNQVAKKS